MENNDGTGGEMRAGGGKVFHLGQVAIKGEIFDFFSSAMKLKGLRELPVSVLVVLLLKSSDSSFFLIFFGILSFQGG